MATLLSANLPARASRRLRRVFRETTAQAKTAYAFGFAAATSLRHEQRAYRQSDWAALKLHLSARLNQIALASKSALYTAFSLCNTKTVEGLRYEEVDRHRSALREILTDVTVEEVLAVQDYFRYFGDFRLANFFRLEALYLQMMDHTKVGAVSKMVLTAALELKRPDTVLELLAAKKVLDRERADLEEVKALACALRGDKGTANRIWSARFGEQDRLFHKYLKGKRVAVVGPAPPGESVGREIDGYDVVVRTNYRIGSNTPTAMYGQRTDVTYYNHYRMSSHFQEVLAATEGLSWVVLKSPHDEQRYRQGRGQRVGEARSAFVAHPIAFHSAPMGIPSIISDLIRFEPQELRLFGTNFYCSRENYSQTYRKSPLSPAGIAESLRVHEPFCGFVFVQNLVQAEICTTDNVTQAVLNLTRDQYAAELQTLYGACILPNPPGSVTW